MNAQPKQINPILKLHPKQSEAKKVSVDDGYTQIPNELLKAILRSGVLGWKGSYLLATVLKTLSWHKESDWFTHSQVCEMMNIEPTKYHINQLSAARKELIRENILFEDGKETGVNLSVFEWKMVYPEKVGNGYPEKVGNTKETITKEKINNEFTNVNSVQQPETSLPKKTKSEPVDYQGVMEEFNRAVEDTPIPQIRAMSDERKRSVHALAKILRKEFGGYTRQHFADYFNDFVRQASSRKDRFYFGGLDGSAWVANFGYIIRSKTFYKTWEDSL
ncbi:TPA: replication protein [Mannheimia haemolytica]|nr:replication protein [Mannheimia haemolytica]HDL5561360.1 replication protein [Mannheimia haemolytica]HDL5666933.1 replication protein [Mannheimia haemolytica]HDL5765445.1 replication protein [Mannheimia haemolytica]